MEYLDKIFCEYWRECTKGATCVRALTDQVRGDSAKWWGTDSPPLCMFEGHPVCFAPLECGFPKDGVIVEGA